MHRYLTLLLHHLGFCDHPEPWMGPLGDCFISDKELTCAYLADRGPFSPRAIEMVSEMLGFTMVARIKGRRFLIAKNYVEEILQHRVVRRGKDYVIGETYSAVYERMLRSRIVRDFDGTGYWVCQDDPVGGFREHFKPMTAAEFHEAISHLPFDEAGFPVVTPPDEETLRIARSLRKPG